jgi:hypothetical protein
VAARAVVVGDAATGAETGVVLGGVAFVPACAVPTTATQVVWWWTVVALGVSGATVRLLGA